MRQPRITVVEVGLAETNLKRWKVEATFGCVAFKVMGFDLPENAELYKRKLEDSLELIALLYSVSQILLAYLDRD